MLRVVRDWALPVATFAMMLGLRVSSPGASIAQLEHEAAAQRVVNAAAAEAISAIGRERCNALGAVRGAAFGYPCGPIQGEGRWPLPKLPTRADASSTAIAPAPAVPDPAPLPRALLAGLLVPAVPSRPER